MLPKVNFDQNIDFLTEISIFDDFFATVHFRRLTFKPKNSKFTWFFSIYFKFCWLFRHNTLTANSLRQENWPPKPRFWVLLHFYTSIFSDFSNFTWFFWKNFKFCWLFRHNTLLAYNLEKKKILKFLKFWLRVMTPPTIFIAFLINNFSKISNFGEKKSKKIFRK